MLDRIALALLAVVALALAGCGGTTTTVTAPASSAKAKPKSLTTTYTSPPAVGSASYTVSLAGFPRGAANGSGVGVVSINSSSGELCWTISQLKNVTAPTEIRIFRNFPRASGAHGLPLGAGYKPSGCMRERLLVLGLIEAKPETFYLSIHSARYPEGAVRGPL
jgi:hypothetical protein